jgi:carbamoyltransferase
MKICGLKLTHDGAIALIDNDRLVFSIEIEKLNNNHRYAMIEDTAMIEKILNEQGYALQDIDHFAIDGWGGYNADELAIQPRLRIADACNYLSCENNGSLYELGVAQYQERDLTGSLHRGLPFYNLQINSATLPYTSYLHVTGHILSAYCTSPFAARHENAYVLVWDGGMFPCLYHVDGSSKQMTPYGPIFLLIGNIYTIFSQHFGPFKVEGNFAKDSLSVAGKVMAYIAKGQCREDLFPLFRDLLNSGFENPMGYANILANEFKKALKAENKNYSDEDILRTFHEFLKELLIEKLSKKINRINNGTTNICIAGGCALNIKWNSAIRNAGLFKEVYVPPFPNDSGSAIGVACAKRYELTGALALDWSVYSGPAIIKNAPYEGWESRTCNVSELAALLHETSEPVVFLNDRAELGPRALGNRSILASARSTGIKEILNDVKNRESYRPVSPICMEEHSEALFVPGNTDPFMVFDHMVKEHWMDKIPGIIHLDNTARLQTINAKQNAVIHELLTEYHRLSGVPLLCNTSANHNGKGFFPDVYSATKWNKVNFVWCEGTLFSKTQPNVFLNV